MEKYDDSDILDDTMDDKLVVRSFNSFPGYFSKALKSRDNVLTFTTHFSVLPYLGTSTPCYRVYTQSALDLGHRISLSGIIAGNEKFTTYAQNFAFYRILGCKVTGWSVCTDSPFSGTYIERSSYPPMTVTLLAQYDTPEESLSLASTINCDTTFRILSDGDEHSKSYIFPGIMINCGKWMAIRPIPSTYFYLYIGGFVLWPLSDITAVSEAFQLNVTMYVEFKDYQPQATDY
jgi:hypothetical protein